MPEFSPQLLLPLQPPQSLSFSNFFTTPANQQLVTQLQQSLRGGDFFLYLWSNLPSTGRSHLLQACAQQASEQQQQVFYVSLRHITQFSPLLLQSIEQAQVICIDDIDAIAGNSLWEEALFHLYNKVKQQSHRLVLSANAPPSLLPIALADLRSRLQADLIYQLKSMSEVEKQQALQWRAKQRGMIISDEIMTFLWKHWERDMGALLIMLGRLDEISLIEKRKLTIPFIKQVLGL